MLLPAAVVASKMRTNLTSKIGTVISSTFVQLRGRKEIVEILQYGKISKQKKGRKMFDEDSIKLTILYIFHPDHVQLLSCGTKRLNVRG